MHSHRSASTPSSRSDLRSKPCPTRPSAQIISLLRVRSRRAPVQILHPSEAFLLARPNPSAAPARHRRTADTMRIRTRPARLQSSSARRRSSSVAHSGCAVFRWSSPALLLPARPLLSSRCEAARRHPIATGQPQRQRQHRQGRRRPRSADERPPKPPDGARGPFRLFPSSPPPHERPQLPQTAGVGLKFRVCSLRRARGHTCA